MKWIDVIDREIKAIKTTAKPVHIKLTQASSSQGIYRGALPFKIEGEYVLSAKGISPRPVVVEWNDSQVTIEMEDDIGATIINAFLSKDESLLLKAVKDNMKSEEFIAEPTFIVGPPGTGKTKVIVKILEEAVKNSKKVLVLSHANMAVQNVFERLDIKSIGIDINEVVLTVKTEMEELKKYSPAAVKKRKEQPILVELGIFKMAKEDYEKIKRDAQPRVEALKNSEEAANTIFANLQRDLKKIEISINKLNDEIESVDSTIKALSGNVLLKTVASIFSSKKIEELQAEKVKFEKELSFWQEQKGSLIEKIKEAKVSKTDVAEELKKAAAEIFEAESTLATILDRINECNKELEAIRADNIYKDAKIVGATLATAALRSKIQSDEYDMIIIDEASMALIPYLLVATQPLKIEEIKPIKYIDDPSLYEAQNRAVELALNSKIVMVGDPQQLSPIAKDIEMKQNIFSLYGVEEIFNGKSVKNTILLDINFRNHPNITEMASKLFYGGLLKSGKESEQKDALFIRRSTSKAVSSQGSYVNHGNMKIALDHVKQALNRGRRSIGVITPYKEQAKIINEQLDLLRKEFPDADMQAGTVHIFQGKEKEIIIYDLTYSPAPGVNVPPTYSGGKNSETSKLLNVAMTRAQDFFIVVGDTEGILNLQGDLMVKEWISELKK